MGPSSLCQPSRRVCCMLTFENHCPRIFSSDALGPGRGNASWVGPRLAWLGPIGWKVVWGHQGAAGILGFPSHTPTTQ